MTYDNREERDDEPMEILAGVDSRSKPFHAGYLNWRPKETNEKIPDEVWETRLSLLSDEDRSAVEREFSDGKSGKEFKSLFFGGNVYGKETKNAAVTMLRCAFVAGDASGAMRIFRASAAFDGDRMKDGSIMGYDRNGKPVLYDATQKYRELAEDAARIENNYREKMPEEKNLTSRMKAKGSKEISRGGKER